MTQPIVKINSKTIDLTFKVNVESLDGGFKKIDITIRVYGQHLGDAIESAKKHIRSKLINFHSIA